MIEKVNIPEGTSGDWSVKKFEISAAESARGQFHYGFRAPPQGKYTKLSHKGSVIMSDTPAEMLDHYDFYMQASGNVLVAGLGLGMVITALAKKEDVKSIVVVEKSEDVIKLVAPHIHDQKITIIHRDIHDIVPKKDFTGKFDHAWFDIWGNVSEEDLQEMRDLQMKFRRCVRKSDCWGKKLIMQRIRQS